LALRFGDGAKRVQAAEAGLHKSQVRKFSTSRLAKSFFCFLHFLDFIDFCDFSFLITFF